MSSASQEAGSAAQVASSSTPLDAQGKGSNPVSVVRCVCHGLGRLDCAADGRHGCRGAIFWIDDASSDDRARYPALDLLFLSAAESAGLVVAGHLGILPHRICGADGSDELLVSGADFAEALGHSCNVIKDQYFASTAIHLPRDACDAICFSTLNAGAEVHSKPTLDGLIIHAHHNIAGLDVGHLPPSLESIARSAVCQQANQSRDKYHGAKSGDDEEVRHAASRRCFSAIVMGFK